MKKVIAFSIISILLFQATGTTAMLCYFHLNRDYFAKNLCVEKNIVTSNCKGSCCLKKQLDETSKKSQGFPGLKTAEIVLYFQEIFEFHPMPIFVGIHSAVGPLKMNFIYSRSSDSVFHPPPII